MVSGIWKVQCKNNCNLYQNIVAIQLCICSSIAGNPLSLSRLARVSLRKAFGPSDLNERLPSLDLSEDLVKFVMSVRDDCCSGNEAKAHALLGRTLIVKSAATTKF